MTAVGAQRLCQERSPVSTALTLVALFADSLPTTFLEVSVLLPPDAFIHVAFGEIARFIEMHLATGEER
jgi:hypothetical protein